MPCNARVVVKATVEIGDKDLFIQKLKERGVTVNDMGDRFRMVYGSSVTVDLFKSGKAEIKSNADTWDEGVAQIKRIMLWLGQNGITFDDVGQPETHRHDHVSPWQKRGIHG